MRMRTEVPLLNRDITFENRTILGSGTIQYHFQHISDDQHTLKKL